MDIGVLDWDAPPETVFHYTDQAGLFGVLRSGELWATRIHCLNDHQEFRHGLDILSRAVLIRNGSPVDHATKDQVSSTFDSVKSLNICVSSWSEHRDQLSQWRAYGKSRQAYALGLRSEDLKRRSRSAGWNFGRCLYKDEEKQRFSEKVAESFWSHFDKHQRENPSLDQSDRVTLLLQAFVIPYASFFKHAGFWEEAEWRLVSPPIKRTDTAFVVRPGPHFPITYYKFSMSKETGERLEAEIVVGPGPSQELASHGAAIASVGSIFDVQTRMYSQTPWRTDA